MPRARPPLGPAFRSHHRRRPHVPFHKGDYHDALRHKNNQVALLLVECYGGIASGGARLLRYLARRASDKKRGRDGTKYSKFHPRGYLSHHLAAINMAAVYTDAVHIADGTASSVSSSARWLRATPLREHPTAPTPVG